ncbi:cytochrome P450 71B34 [Manihot esculenta]|uniref:Cytochrome P450 n=1 Tax=Manihot esculenta TaxID=3983 RepID=A0A2C9VZM3_MANES|nr:cytochrome P450 71B34 [Manihot esculenta]OAY51954.1 hypothetical protein MANES_04G045800v8 [Manihot esculenta]
MAFPSVAIPFLLLLFFILRRKFQGKRKSKHLPPGPPGLPIIGNLHQLGALPHRSLWELSQKYGPVMSLRLGCVPTVTVSTAETAREVLKTHDLYTCSRPVSAGTKKLSYNYIDVGFSPYGEYWRKMRKICVLELFSARRVQSFHFIREEEVASLVDFASKSASSSTPVDLSEKFMSLTANVICRAAFGKSFKERGFRHDRFQEVVHECIDRLGSFSAADFFPYVGRIIDRLSGLHAKIERSFEEFDAFYEKAIDDHIKKGKEEPGHEDFIDVLLLELGRSQAEADPLPFSKDHIKAILMDIFIGGVDTGTITLIWTMTELARHPRVMRKVQEEIRTCIGDKGKVSESDIEKLEYLRMVLKETYRLHPTGLLIREAMSKINISGYEIDPKTLIQINVWAIGRDPEIWKNPDEFFPERFMHNQIDFTGQNFELLPFGAGRRGCPGMSMGLATVGLALANLLYHFDWKLPYNMKEEDISIEEAPGIITSKKDPLLLVPVRYPHA